MSWENIKDSLEAGYAEFNYIKKNGDIRIASGTRNREVLDQIKTFTFAGRQPSDKVVPYWDFDREDWRCFLKTNAGSCSKRLDAAQVIDTDTGQGVIEYEEENESTNASNAEVQTFEFKGDKVEVKNEPEVTKQKFIFGDTEDSNK